MPDASYSPPHILEKALFEVPSCDLFIWNKIFLADIIKNNNIRFDTNISLGEDRAFIFDCLIHVKSLLSISEKLYIYTADHENSLTDQFATAYYEKACSHLKVVEHICKSWSQNSAISTYATERMLNWASKYVYRPRKDVYSKKESDALIAAVLNLFSIYFSNAIACVLDDGIKFHIGEVL